MKRNLSKFFKKTILSTCILVSFTHGVNAQVGIGTKTPDQSAMLDVFAADKGLLVPRVALQSTTDAVTIPNPATSLFVYNTNPNIAGAVGVGFYYNSGTPAVPRWSRLAPDGTAWIIGGNKGTNPVNHFIGTTDNADVVMRRADAEVLRFYTGGNMVASGGVAYAPVPVNGSGTRMMYLPAGKGGAFRVGTVNGLQWTEASIGSSSFASGLSTTASGAYSFATGGSTVAAGQGAFAAGLNSQALTGGAVAMGTSAIASGNGAVAIGENVEAAGIAATALGTATHATGDHSTALGWNTTASAAQATATGYGSVASALNATAMGINTKATGQNSMATGNGSIASGSNSTAMGGGSEAKGNNSFAIGTSALATGPNSFVGGSGGQTTINGVNAFAFGSDASAESTNALAIGDNAVATGNTSAAFGNNTKAAGMYAVATGQGTRASIGASFVVGRYNIEDVVNNTFAATRKVFVVGNGTAEASRSDAFVIRGNGNTEVNGSLTVGAVGTPINNIIKVNKFINFPAMTASGNAGAVSTQTVAIPNTKVGATVYVSPIAGGVGNGVVIAWARVSVDGTVQISLTNTSEQPIDPANMEFSITVIQ